MLEPSLATYYDGLHVTPAGARAVAAGVAVAALRLRPAFATFTAGADHLEPTDTYDLRPTGS
jgi:hypothetical protein